LAPVYLAGVLLDPLKQPFGLFFSHLAWLRLGLLARLGRLFLRRFFGLRTLIRILIGILLLLLILLLLVLLPVLILLILALILVLLAVISVLGLRSLLLLLHLLFERQLEVVLVVDLSRIDTEGLFVRFGTLLEPLLPVKRVT
jgi:hypothetical protein